MATVTASVKDIANLVICGKESLYLTSRLEPPVSIAASSVNGPDIYRSTKLGIVSADLPIHKSNAMKLR